MGEWIRGEITTRRLCVLADHLPQDSPLRMLRSEGKVWGLHDQLTWMVLGELARLNYYLRSRWRIKKHQDKFSWPKTPWEESETSKTYGFVASEDQMDAIKYLRSLSPKNQQ